MSWAPWPGKNHVFPKSQDWLQRVNRLNTFCLWYAETPGLPPEKREAVLRLTIPTIV